MKIIAHRGYWIDPEEKNTMKAFKRAFENKLGIELDVRDCVGEMVISHGFPNGSEITLEEVLKTRQEYNNKEPLAIHLNACGLGDSVNKLLDAYAPDREGVFCFGNPIPDLNACVKKEKFPIWTMASDICPTPPLLEKVKGVWMECYSGDWNALMPSIKNLLESDKKVCLTSDDLYGRNNDKFFEGLTKSGLYLNKNLILCTNKPNEASIYFQNTLNTLIHSKNSRGG